MPVIIDELELTDTSGATAAATGSGGSGPSTESPTAPRTLEGLAVAMQRAARVFAD